MNADDVAVSPPQQRRGSLSACQFVCLWLLALTFALSLPVFGSMAVYQINYLWQTIALIEFVEWWFELFMLMLMLSPFLPAALALPWVCFNRRFTAVCLCLILLLIALYNVYRVHFVPLPPGRWQDLRYTEAYLLLLLQYAVVVMGYLGFWLMSWLARWRSKSSLAAGA